MDPILGDDLQICMKGYWSIKFLILKIKEENKNVVKNDKNRL